MQNLLYLRTPLRMLRARMWNDVPEGIDATEPVVPMDPEELSPAQEIAALRLLPPNRARATLPSPLRPPTQPVPVVRACATPLVLPVLPPPVVEAEAPPAVEPPHDETMPFELDDAIDVDEVAAPAPAPAPVVETPVSGVAAELLAFDWAIPGTSAWSAALPSAPAPMPKTADGSAPHAMPLAPVAAPPVAFAPIPEAALQTARVGREAPRWLTPRVIIGGACALAFVVVGMVAVIGGGSSNTPAPASTARSETPPAPVERPASVAPTAPVAEAPTAAPAPTPAQPAMAASPAPAPHVVPAVQPPVPAARPVHVASTYPVRASRPHAQLADPWATPAASKRVAVAQPAQGTVAITTNPPCTIVVDGKPTKLVTPQRALALPAGNHILTFVDARHQVRGKLAVHVEPQRTTKIIRDFTK